jgi:excinuclease ABC subunit A
MSKARSDSVIRLRGVRQNNLKGFDLDLPLARLIVLSGLSGSGKSSLAFETLFAEGQRRYIETFSPYVRQFFDRMDKPRVDSIEGIPPAIAIEQRNAVRTTRSTVGTMTEVCDYMKAVWLHLAQLHCRGCDRQVSLDSPQSVWTTLTGALRSPEAGTATPGPEAWITFDLPLSDKLPLEESLRLVERQGYRRLLAGGEPLPIEDALPRFQRSVPPALTVIQDRIRLAPVNRTRFVEACEQAYHFGKGKLTVRLEVNGAARTWRFSNRLHCAECDLEYGEPTPALFSFNHPLGACPACKGFGRLITIDYALAIPDRTLTLAQGAVKPWRTGFSAECQDDLRKFCRVRQVPMDVPFRELTPEHRDWVTHGDRDYGADEDHEWPRAWYGVKGYFRWLESKAYKMHVRVLLSRYRAYTPCPDCGGRRFRPEALLYRLAVGHAARLDDAPDPADVLPLPRVPHPSSITLADFYRLTIRDASRFIAQVTAGRHARPTDPLMVALGEVRSRLDYLVEVGLGYLTLDRPTRSLSGGETERVNLTTCLGTRLVNTLYVLDEPSVGLHPRDTSRLIRILQALRDLGNTVVVVEHEAAVIRAADHIVDLGPGHGESGGQVIFQGSPRAILRSRLSLTGQYLSGRRRIELPARRIPSPAPADRPEPDAALTLTHASLHNLKDLTVRIPLNRLVCVTGVSGSGKTTLVGEVLHPLLAARVHSGAPGHEPRDEADDDAREAAGSAPATGLEGADALSRVVLVDQSAIGRTPRSNPAVYIGAFDDIRELFAQSEPARQRGFEASAFSFNSPQGQCERCRGAGFEKIEMQFLSDVFIRCPDCRGRRYRPHILEVKLDPSGSSVGGRAPAWSIADLLEATVDEVVSFLGRLPDARPARRAAAGLRLLQDVGLGYLRLGQPVNTLSGGESQRLKLVGHLAEFARADEQRATLFLFDEPTTGLHFDDVRVLLEVFRRLVDAGHSVIVVEHNVELIQAADWIIDLGPEAGDEGGRIVAEGTPERIAGCAASHTGKALLEAGVNPRRRLRKGRPRLHASRLTARAS